MLQIGSGKLFSIGTLRVNTLKGIIYTNLNVLTLEPHDVGIGKISALTQDNYPYALLWEFDEHIEGDERAAGVLASNGIRHYINDYSVVMSFFLNAVCTTNPALTERITYSKEDSGYDLPNNLMARFFDKSIIATRNDLDELREGATRLHGLKRDKFRLLMKSIKTYVAALHRMAEDLDLAYTLMVMSIEVLAQTSSPMPSDWNSYPSEKRTRIDKALEGADPELANRVREAVKKNDHYAIGKRFKEFILKHTPDSYFDHKPESPVYRVGRRDFESALNRLYGTRSSFVHTLANLPIEIKTYGKSYEITDVGNAIHFTFEGLSRLCRSVIIDYLSKQDQIDKEPYNYTSENPNIRSVRLAPEYWATSSAGLSEERGNLYLKGFLLAIDSMYLKGSEGTILDMRQVISASKEIIEKSKDLYSRPYSCIVALFNTLVPETYKQSVNHNKRFMRLVNDPSVESLCSHISIGCEITWTLEEIKKCAHEYYRQRENEKGLVVSKRMEACIDLSLAGAYRKAQDIEGLKLQLISIKQNHPNILELHEFLENYTLGDEINWLDAIYPMRNSGSKKSTLEYFGL